MPSSATYVPPLQRAIRAMFPRGTPCGWAHEATELERAGLSQYASELLEVFKPLSPLEALLGAKHAGSSSERGQRLLNSVHLRHQDLSTDYLQYVCSEPWSLGADGTWTDKSKESQLLLLRHAAVSLSIVRPQYSGQYSTLDTNNVWKRAHEDVQHDPLAQCIVACNNPSLFSMWMSPSHVLAPQAVALGFLQGLSNTRACYEKMDETAFASLIKPDPDPLAREQHKLVWVLHQNKTLYRFPWEWASLVAEHNPALLIAGALNNHDVANAKSHMDQWFGPAIMAVSHRYQQQSSHTWSPWLVDITSKQQKRFEKLVQRHFPKGYPSLMLIKDLYSTGKPNGHLHTNKEWFACMASLAGPPNEHLPNLDNGLFEESISP